MPYGFSFNASTLTSAGYLDRANFTTGSYPGLDYPTERSAVAPSQSIATSGGVDVMALTMVAGQTYRFDIDGAALDLELDIINQTGVRVGGSDNAGGGRDPFLSFTPSQTGTYFVAVHHAANDYVNGFFEFERTPGPTGAYKLFVSTPTVTSRTFTRDNTGESLSFSDSSQTVKALGGSDTILLNGGNDIGLGGSGNDSLFGGSGSDELSGGSGGDRVEGGSGDDVLRGGTEADRLYGGTERDGLSGGTGNDLLRGGSGNDTLWGEAGSDAIYGEAGNDFIRGGEGLDVLYGGTGADTFHFLRGEAPANNFQAEDRIQDFGFGDQIDLSDLAAGTLAWRGYSSSFTGANQVRLVELDNGYVDVRVNLDSDSAAEVEVLVRTSGDFDLIRDDFIL